MGIIETQDSPSAPVVEGEAVTNTMGHRGCWRDQSHLDLRPVSRLQTETLSIEIQQGCEVIMSAHLMPNDTIAHRWTHVVMSR